MEGEGHGVGQKGQTQVRVDCERLNLFSSPRSTKDGFHAGGTPLTPVTADDGTRGVKPQGTREEDFGFLQLKIKGLNQRSDVEMARLGLLEKYLAGSGQELGTSWKQEMETREEARMTLRFLV